MNLDGRSFSVLKSKSANSVVTAVFATMCNPSRAMFFFIFSSSPSSRQLVLIEKLKHLLLLFRNRNNRYSLLIDTETGHATHKSESDADF